MTGWLEVEAIRYDLKQAEILSCSAKVFAELGFEKASIRRIAAESGMSISALYYYFTSKDELLFSIQHSSFNELLEKLETKLHNETRPERKLYILIENHLDHFLGRFSELIICSHEINTLKGEAYEKVLAIRRRYYDIALSIVSEIQAEQKGSALQASLAALNLFGMLNWIHMWYDPEKSDSSAEISLEIYNLFLNGINSRGRSAPLAGGSGNTVGGDKDLGDLIEE